MIGDYGGMEDVFGWKMCSDWRHLEKGRKRRVGGQAGFIYSKWF